MLKYPGLVFVGVLSLVAACGDDAALPADAGIDMAGPIDAATDAPPGPFCGDGNVDPGEDCDDGLRGLSHDGCSSTCKTEMLTWRNLTPNPMDARWNHAMAWDTARATAVMFGGRTDVGVSDETFTWDNDHWDQAIPMAIPPAREQFAMTNDAARQRVVIFGGLDSNGVSLGDTWTWNGATWVDAMPTTSPPPRARAQIAYDPVRQVVVLFGGDDGTTAYRDTWEWDGTAWSAKTPAHVPPSGATAMSWSGTTVQLVYGSSNWQYDGTDWTEVPFSYIGPWGDPLGDQGWALYDSTGNRQLLITARGNDLHGQWIFAWNGTDWAPIAQPNTGGPGGLSLGRRQMSAALDPATGAVLTFGGSIGSGIGLDATWIWTSADGWEELHDSVPPPRLWTSLTYDALRARLVMFGGDTWGKRLNDTWEWNGTWNAPPLSTRPPAREPGQLAYDSIRGELVLFGGFGNTYSTFGYKDNVPVADTWVHDGSSWVQRHPSHSPPAVRPSMAFDAARGNVVLVGLGGATWTWDGTDWTEQHPAHALPGALSLAYDARRTRIVAVTTEQTWEWDGTDWALASSTAPAFTVHLFYDPARGRVISQGNGGARVILDEWDGSTWTRLFTSNLFYASPYMAADPTTRSWFQFGLDWNTWQGRYESAETDERCDGTDADNDGLVRCADPDCWARCTPLCPPYTTCPANAPRCGDSTCSSIEDHALCPADCP